MIVAALFAMATFTACTPEESDAFIDGFYNGYYGYDGSRTATEE